MAKKHNVSDNFMDDMDQLPGLPAKGGDLAMFDDYKKLEVSQKKLELKKDAQELINQFAALYLSDDSINMPEYVKAIKKAESTTLTALLSQVRYAEHALESLMIQLDSGGFTNPETYEMIMKMQTNALDITLRVSQYTRSLPEYFQYLEKDITKYTAINLKESGSSTVIDKDSGEESEVEEFSSAEPIRGTHNLMKQIQSIAKEMKANEKVEDAEIINDAVVSVQDVDTEKGVSEETPLTDAAAASAVENATNKVEDEIESRFEA